MKLEETEITFRCEQGHSVSYRFKTCPVKTLLDGRSAIGQSGLHKVCKAELRDIILDAPAFDRIVDELKKAKIQLDVGSMLCRFQVGDRIRVREDCKEEPGGDEYSEYAGYVGAVTKIVVDENGTVLVDAYLDDVEEARFYPEEIYLEGEPHPEDELVVAAVQAADLTSIINAPAPAPAPSTGAAYNWSTTTSTNAW